MTLLTRTTTTPSLVHHSAWLVVCQVFGFCALTALLAQVRIPLPGTAVPMTLQSLAVLLTGYLLPVRRAVAAMVLYIALGIAGLPVFATASAGLWGATGGYLLGFVLAAALISLLKGASPGLARLTMAGIVGTIAIFAVGVPWYAVSTGSLSAAVAGGLIPFLPKAVLQLGVAVAAVRVIGCYQPRGLDG